jgi:hypothetical protein
VFANHQAQSVQSTHIILTTRTAEGAVKLYHITSVTIHITGSGAIRHPVHHPAHPARQAHPAHPNIESATTNVKFSGN